MSGVSKRTRFEVFKRDKFTCQYCWRKPPEVILEPDHVIPSCDGGSDHMDNLVTACFDCNRGKAGVSLDSLPQTISDKIAQKLELTLQVKALDRLLKRERKQEDCDIHEVGVFWYNLFMQKKNGFVFGPSRIPSIRRFLQSLHVTDLTRFAEKAIQKRPPRNDDDEQAFRYFCGICWNRIKGKNTPTT